MSCSALYSKKSMLILFARMISKRAMGSVSLRTFVIDALHVRSLARVTLAFVGIVVWGPLAVAEVLETSAPINEVLEQRLLREIRTARENSNGPIFLEMKSEEFRLNKTIVLGPEFSGTPDRPVVLRGAAGHGTRLRGSQPVRARPLTSTEQQSLVAMVADPSQLLIIDLEPNSFSEQRQVRESLPDLGIFENGRRLTPARWPNSDYARVGELSNKVKAEGSFSFEVPPTKIMPWRRESDMWVGGYFAHDWFYETAPVLRADVSRNSISLARPDTLYTPAANGRFFVYNALSELDMPGEYYWDRTGNRVILRPFESTDSEKIIDLAEVDAVLTVSKAKHVKIENIAFEESRGDTVSIDNSSHIVLSDCFVGNSGAGGIKIDGGKSNIVERCVIANVAKTAISLKGGDRQTLDKADHAVKDSVIVRFGQLWRTYHPAVSLAGVGSSVEGCFITEGPHAAITYEGNEHRIALNEITEVATETGDSGAIYSGRDWASRGNIIEGNYFHHITPANILGSDHRYLDVKGVYLDDMLSGITVRGNVFYKVMQPVFIGGGRNNSISGNIFLDPIGPAISIDDRGLRWASPSVNDPESTIRKRLRAVPYDGPVYADKYPELPNILGNNPGSPDSNTLDGNIAIGGVLLSAKQAVRDLQRLGHHSRNTEVKFSESSLYQLHHADLHGVLLEAGVPTSHIDLKNLQRRARLSGLPFFGRAFSDAK